MARALLTALDTAQASGTSGVIGDVVTISTAITVGGVATDPTTISLVVESPDQSTTTYASPTHDGAGAYHVDVTPAAAGHYVYRWVATGAAAGAAEGSFDIRAAFASSALVDIEDAKLQLGIATTNVSKDAEVQGYIDAAVAIVENVVGPVVPRTVTELYDGGRSRIWLYQCPVVSITTVTEYSAGVATVLAPETVTVSTSSDYLIDLAAGVLHRRSGWSSTCFPSGRRNVAVVYVAGYAPIPGNIRLATVELVRHLYQQTQQGGAPAFPGTEAVEDAVPETFHSPFIGFAIPNRVLELLSPHKRPPVVA